MQIISQKLKAGAKNFWPFTGFWVIYIWNVKALGKNFNKNINIFYGEYESVFNNFVFQQKIDHIEEKQFYFSKPRPSSNFVWCRTRRLSERVRCLCGCLTAFNLRHYNSRQFPTLLAFKCSAPQNPGSSSRESHDKPNMILRQCYYHQR